MGKSQQTPLSEASDLLMSAGYPFCLHLNRAFEPETFCSVAPGRRRRVYTPLLGRSSLTPGRYFGLRLTHYFEGLESARGMASWAAASMAIRRLLGVGLEAGAPYKPVARRTKPDRLFTYPLLRPLTTPDLATSC